MYFLLAGDISGPCIGMRAIGAAPWPCIVHRYARYARLGVAACDRRGLARKKYRAVVRRPKS